LNEEPQSFYARRREILNAAMQRLAPRARVLPVTGALLILLGSAALAISLFSHSAPLIAIGILMFLGGLLESGVGHHASGDGPATPWQISGGAHIAAALLIFAAFILPSMLFSTFLGAAILLAGLTWLRMAFALPDALQAPILPICGGFTSLIGLLIISRWAGDDYRMLALMLACEMLIRGWAWVGFGFVFMKKLDR